MPSLVHDTVQLNIVRIGSKQIKFKLHVDEHLPSRLIGDEIRLKQILNNLLSNGIKYTEEGYVKLSVSHAEKDGDMRLYFVVEDTGQGMTYDDQEKLFTEYLRFNTEFNRSVEGTGLGLSITQRLVKMMGGTIQAESEYGKGSVFFVEVKQGFVECEEIGFELAEKLNNFTYTVEKHPASQQFINRSLMPYGKILVVDDVETNLYVAEGLLAPYKLTVETASSGLATLDKIAQGQTYDIIFMDHMMPKMDGIETTQRLRSNGYKGVIVALTANALTGNDEMFRKHGFDGFISKPIDMRQLNAVLNTFVRDKHPIEAKSVEQLPSEVTTQTVSPKLLEIFCRDAKKAVITLKEALKNGDIKLFTTTAHAMKSALANVAEYDASKTASSLEEAGLKDDMAFISANIGHFIKTLNMLIKRITSLEPTEYTDVDMIEDTAYLAAQLKLIESACEEYDDGLAYATLDRLQEKQWNKETADLLGKIRDRLFFDSDFEGAAQLSRMFLIG